MVSMRLKAIFQGGNHSRSLECVYSVKCVQGSTCDQLGKNPLKYCAWLGMEPGPQGGQTVNYPTELS